MDKTLELVKQEYEEYFRKEDGFIEEYLQDILKCNTIEELADYLHYDLHIYATDALVELYKVMLQLIPKPLIDCRFYIELSAMTHCQAYMNELVMSTNPYHLHGWTEHEVRTIFGYIGKPLSNSHDLRDHVEAAKSLEVKFNKALTEAYGENQETYVHIGMTYHINTCTYMFNVDDYGSDNPQAENATLGDREPLPHWSLFRVLYAKK